MDQTISYLFPLLVNILRYFILAGIPFLVFYLLFPRFFKLNKIQKKMAQRKDFLREIGNSLLTNLILVGVALIVLKTPLKAYTQVYAEVDAYPVWWIFVSVGIALILHDTYFYWMHRTIHHPKLFKSFHLTHHKSMNPSPWASYSFHVLEAFLEALIIPLMLFLIPMHLYSILLFGMASFLINVYGHLGYEIMPKWYYRSWLFEIFNSSVHHNLHHEKFDGNYGLYFRIWDRIMGTEHPEYVQRYHALQEQRFGPSSERKKIKWILLPIVIFCLSGLQAVAQQNILGYWDDPENEVIVHIYQEGDQFFGKAVKAKDPDQQSLLDQHEPMVLLNFRKENEDKLCCGKIFQPKYQRTLSGTLILVDEKTLKVIGRKGLLSGSKLWTKSDYQGD